ncbi:M14 family zinc carboxypeptidase [Nocardia brasiliensis]|uniref:M14 family zinc carboxypeptidase n=1 Tax=Nocardia brasiliensis TaxID=37326 RepID=UPI002455A676|nr:M14 family zinc carboxypeptidase [Nocardia brasiliensis]
MADQEPRVRRYFVEVSAESAAAMRALSGRGLDLFRATVAGAGDAVTIAGYLSVAEIGGLAEDGYTVTVQAVREIPPLEIASSKVSAIAAHDVETFSVPAGYLPYGEIEGWISSMVRLSPAFCTKVQLPLTSVEGRPISALRIRAGDRAERDGVLLLGGAHARELINPDLLCHWMYHLTSAYRKDTDLTFGPVTYSNSTVRLLLESLDIFIVPLVNPDGREFVMSADRMWRKNRSYNPGSDCRGVDVNRNYDFLFDSGIGTSAFPCDYQTYRGPQAFSEPETRNVRWLLDVFPHIIGMVDVHSFGEIIAYPWGDDDNQTTDPAMNFRVPHPDRGIPGDNLYREYMPAEDLDWYRRTAVLMRDAITKVRGSVYTVQQSVSPPLLYPVSASVDDYVYSRNFIDPAKRKVRSITIETSKPVPRGEELRGFQPVYEEARQVMVENGPALIEFCLSVMCPGRGAAAMRTTLDRHLPEAGAVRDAYDHLMNLAPRVLAALAADPDMRTGAAKALAQLADRSAHDHDPVLDEQAIADLTPVATYLAHAVPEARPALDVLTALAKQSVGGRISRALKS